MVWLSSRLYFTVMYTMSKVAITRGLVTNAQYKQSTTGKIFTDNFAPALAPGVATPQTLPGGEGGQTKASLNHEIE